MADVLLIGGGGREHAIAAALASSPSVHTVTVSPGNAGTSQLPDVRNRPLNIKDHKEVVQTCIEWGISLVVIGPEAPLAEGLADRLAEEDIKVFGPKKCSARIESSKAWAKAFMKRHSIPTAEFETFSDVEAAEKFLDKCDWKGFAIKASGLAGGKGVAVVENKEEAKSVLKEFRSSMKEASETFVIEEKLFGYEVSVLAFTDGSTISVMPPAQDHKQRYNGGLGLNTGGMGAYCPCPLVSQEDLEFIKTNILQKTVDEMRKEGHPYVGVLYAGIMMTQDGPKVLEFNCRFGDPETQSLMLILNSDLYSVMLACVNGTLRESPAVFAEDVFAANVTVVIENYPGSVQKGLCCKIEGMDKIMEKPTNLTIFMGGAKIDETSKDVVTSGGRVLNVCAIGKCLEEAVTNARKGASLISFQNAPQGYKADFRTDIGFAAIKKLREQKCSKLSYEASGVNIEEGYLFVKKISKFSKQTNRPGVRSELGMFGAVFDTKLEGYKDPLLISGTDGVGTKLKIAIEYGMHGTIGQDLVAMCANDILVHAAEPLFFLDYLACGKLECEKQAEIVEGIAKGCRLANCSLVGGETAEMPGMYRNEDYDLAGFAVGAVEKGGMLPKMDRMESGDVLIGIASSGLHSNGFSLVRKIVNQLDLSLNDPAPFNPGQTLGEELLRPTHIYTNLLELFRSDLILGAAHITGGGIQENLLRIIPKSLGVTIDKTWKIPSIFPWLSSCGIKTDEMLRTFNLGLGLIVVTKKGNEKEVLRRIDEAFTRKVTSDAVGAYPRSEFMLDDGRSTSAWPVGSLVENQDDKRIQFIGVDEALLLNSAVLLGNHPDCIAFRSKKRVAVLISGSGTNLQALLDSTMSGPSSAEIVLVISNVEGVEGLRRAARANVPSVVIPHKKFSIREDFEKEINKALKSYDIELVCLAGFMRILTGKFVKEWEGRMVNIHPSLLPSFKGKDAQKQALNAGVCVTGCTVHFVTEEVDAGAIVAQECVPVLLFDDVETLSERIKKAEHEAYPRALQLVANEKVIVDVNGKAKRT